MYNWFNEQRLPTLKTDGEGDQLRFSTVDQEVVVHLKKYDIVQVVCTAKGTTTVLDTPVKKLVVGEGNTTRDVFHYLTPGGPAPTLRLGITKHQGIGSWSSLPHPFELHPEPGFEEAFFYLLEGASQRAIQVGKGVWFDSTNVDGIWHVRDRGWCTIPMGYHPVVGEPGVKVSYVWAYLAKHSHWEKV